MKISEAFPSKWLRAVDLQGRNLKVVISHVEMHDIGDDGEKPVVFFQGKEKGVVLNKTNATNISTAYGDDTGGWAGKEVVLYEAMVDFQGRSVAAIRIRPPNPREKSKPVPAPVPQQRVTEISPPPADMDDDIPF